MMETKDWDFCLDWLHEQCAKDPKFKVWYEKQLESNAPRDNNGTV